MNFFYQKKKEIKKVEKFKDFERLLNFIGLKK